MALLVSWSLQDTPNCRTTHNADGRG